MGFLDKLRAELVDIVEWVDDSRTVLVWRFPRYHNQIKQGAKLIVRPGQVAVFVHKGKLADVFPPGTHELNTENLPILSTLQGWKHGFDSPIKAEIYFVSTRQITELKWGTPKPVIVRDPDFGPVRVRAFGTYTLRASDPRALLSELVGADGEFDVEEINVLLRSLIGSAFAETVANSGLSVPDLAASYGAMSDTLREAVKAKVDDEYGLDIPVLAIVNISLPEEVEQALDAGSSMRAVGDLDSYRSYQISKSVPSAAANPAGGLAAAGVGLGMGMSMLGGMNARGERPDLTLVPPPIGSAHAVWHVAEAGRATGPFTLAEIGEAIAAGRVGAATMVWRPGMAEWRTAGEVDDLAGLLAPPPPPAL